MFFFFKLKKKTLRFYIFGDISLSQLTSSQFNHYHHGAGFLSTVPQYPPSQLQDYSICNSNRLEFPTFLIHALIRMYGTHKKLSPQQVFEPTTISTKVSDLIILEKHIYSLNLDFLTEPILVRSGLIR